MTDETDPMRPADMAGDVAVSLAVVLMVIDAGLMVAFWEYEANTLLRSLGPWGSMTVKFAAAAGLAWLWMRTVRGSEYAIMGATISGGVAALYAVVLASNIAVLWGALP